MRLAFLSDIHGNIAALQAVWQEIQGQGADRVLCAGDLVSFGPRPAEVVDFFLSHDIACVLGNHDAVIAGKADYTDFAFDNDEDRDYVREALAQTKPDMAPRHIQYLQALPVELSFAECSLLMTHCVPDMFLRPDLLAANRYMENRQEQFLFFGHTHVLQVYALDGGKLGVNIPSVGKPKNGNPRAGYCMADIEDGQIHSLQFFFCEYDWDAVCIDIEDKRLPPKTLDFLRNGGTLR